MKLRAKYGRKHYKTNDSYLNAVYRRNKDIIDEKLADVGVEGISTLKQFKNNVYETQRNLKRKGKTSTITRAMNVFTESRDFVSKEEHYLENAIHGFKRFGVIEKLYSLTGKAFKASDLKYVGDKAYSYRGYVIRFNDSPVSVNIYKGFNGKKVASLWNKKNQDVLNTIF